jgi:hypothetical protein
MNIRYSVIVPIQVLLVLAVGIVPASASAQTVVGPEFRLIKSEVFSVQRDERQCDFFLWTKLGGDTQRISFSYLGQDGQPSGDTPRIDNVTIVINPDKKIPTARITGLDDKQQSKWQLEMSAGTYDSNRKCLANIQLLPSFGR